MEVTQDTNGLPSCKWCSLHFFILHTVLLTNHLLTPSAVCLHKFLHEIPSIALGSVPASALCSPSNSPTVAPHLNSSQEEGMQRGRWQSVVISIWSFINPHRGFITLSWKCSLNWWLRKKKILFKVLMSNYLKILLSACRKEWLFSSWVKKSKNQSNMQSYG